MDSLIAASKEEVDQLDSHYAAKVPSDLGHMSYGTAGFRANHNTLDRVCFRVGLLSAVISISEGITGIMVTASHNTG